ncbi:MAG: hypothetical protein VR70_03730 [Rhodospirillaceae bacterium BRH_c57]|nr:MAG: hypothetical protein VR70_03730 [Rhodospirillaceae bacterium BRH_c57]
MALKTADLNPCASSRAPGVWIPWWTTSSARRTCRWRKRSKRPAGFRSRHRGPSIRRELPLCNSRAAARCRTKASASSGAIKGSAPSSQSSAASAST